MKLKPKSCSCPSCKFGKGTKRGNFVLKLAERKFRRKCKQAIKLDAELLTLVPYSTYTD